MTEEAKEAPKETSKEALKEEEAPTNGNSSFSQDQVNKMLADDRRKHQDQTKKAMAEVDALRSKARLTREERDDLDSRMQQLQDELLTKEELSKKELDRARKTHDTQLKELSGERDQWKTKYTDASIRRSITDAAVKADAYNPHQIVRLLQPDTRLVEVLDDGQPTGGLEPKIRFKDQDKDGKPVTLELTPKEAIQRMRELSEYLNLFKGEGIGGLGQNNQVTGRKVNTAELAKDPAAYRKARKDGSLRFST